MALKQLCTMSLGCDPEFFITREGQVIGSEKVLNEKPLVLNNSKVVMDGVQVELNPPPNTCRANLINAIKSAMIVLNDHLKKTGCSASFETSITLSKKELESLSAASRRFGCEPSFSTDPKAKSVGLVKNQENIKSRCAGGHIHFGTYHAYKMGKDYGPIAYDPSVIVLLDVLLGNTCVLLDRDEGNKKRRKTYGRAGEYRLPPHGIEYRTLSNFWLRSIPLTSLVFGLARQVVSIWLNDRMFGTNHANEIVAMVDLKKVQKAINSNNLNLAWENWNKVKDKFFNLFPTSGGDYQGNSEMPLSKERENEFYFLIKEGIDKFWPKDRDIIGEWVKAPEAHEIGWKPFCEGELRTAMNAEKK